MGPGVGRCGKIERNPALGSFERAEDEDRETDRHQPTGNDTDRQTLTQTGQTLTAE